MRTDTEQKELLLHRLCGAKMLQLRILRARPASEYEITDDIVQPGYEITDDIVQH